MSFKVTVARRRPAIWEAVFMAHDVKRQAGRVKHELQQLDDQERCSDLGETRVISFVQ
jgi:hypothetical protein